MTWSFTILTAVIKVFASLNGQPGKRQSLTIFMVGVQLQFNGEERLIRTPDMPPFFQLKLHKLSFVWVSVTTLKKQYPQNHR